ncbi:hypothetical protein BU17DRAFT_54376 [Hysterangium stoloniferum]|nr:hypothetical protein BU17DRAFT_54376 [Hysterangium stoloniferum]
MELPLETPSRIMRRIEVLQAQDTDLPSLPSFPEFDNSATQSFKDSTSAKDPTEGFNGDILGGMPYESTPAPPSSHATRSTVRPPSATSSTTRFANSMRASTTTRSRHRASFELSPPPDMDSASEPSLPNIYPIQQDEDSEDVADVHAHFVHGSMHTSEIRSQAHSSPYPFLQEEVNTPHSKKSEFSVSVRSESKVCCRYVVSDLSIEALLARARTPSLSRTTPSPTSMSSNSIPTSFYSPATGVGQLPQSRTPSPEEIEHVDFEDNRTSDGVYPHGMIDNAHLTQEIEEQSMELEEYMNPQQYEDKQREAKPLEHRSSEEVFSSEEQVQSLSSRSSSSARTRTPFPNAFSSPNQPHNATPIQPGLRDFIMDTPAQATSAPDDDLATPYNRRRSFLLSLVNSTARPRMAAPTPHPLSRMGPTTNARGHPLSQAWTPAPTHLRPTVASESGSSVSPDDRNSFISTASSHDLTVHPRANASFDPITGAKGVGRFNAIKLNTYLHGLNRRLQEENETLVSRLRMLGEEAELGQIAEELEDIQMKRSEDDIQAIQDELAERDLEQQAMKLETDTLIESLRESNRELKQKLEAEREGRREDNEGWKNRLATRMEAVRDGVEETISKMQVKIDEAKQQQAEAEALTRDAVQRCLSMQQDLDVLKQRAEKAENALASSSDLGAELEEAYRLADSHKENARAAAERGKQLEQSLREAERREAESKISSENQLAEMDAELRQSLEAQQNAEAHSLELQAELQEAEESIDELEVELGKLREENGHLAVTIEDLKVKSKQLEVEVARSAETNRQLENAVFSSEEKMIEDEQELNALRAKIGRLERDSEARRERSCSSASLDGSKNSGSDQPVHEIRAEVEQLEAELDAAHKEIGRLNHLLSQSPTRVGINKAKDVRIELLEREKDDLIERIRTLTTMMVASSPSKVDEEQQKTPVAQRYSLSWKTPITPGPPLRDLSWLNDKTNLPNATPLVAQIQYLQQELCVANDNIDKKVNKLEEAGIGIVGLTEKLEDARSRIASLQEEIGRLVRREDRQSRRLEKVRCQECGVKVDLGKLTNNSNNDQSSVEVLFSSQTSNPATPPSKKVEGLRLALQKKTAELDTLRSQWNGERAKLLGKNVVLQDAASRLNRDLDAVKVEVKRAIDNGQRVVSEEAKERANVQADLAKAKAIIVDLENTLKSERSTLRSLSAEQQGIAREKEGLLTQLHRAQSDMDDVRTQLDKVKRDNRELETELRATTTVDQKARLLEAKVAENYNIIENLRGERESLVTDHAALQRRYQEASAQANRLLQELSANQATHEEHRHQLDLRVNEIEDLHNALSDQALAMQKISSEKDQAHADRNDIALTVASLEADLKRVRNDAEALGKDLKELRVERDKLDIRHRDDMTNADKVQKQLSTQIRLANEQLEVYRLKAKKATAEFKNHVCTPHQDVNELRTQHNNECKGLLVQIKYLKAKFTRESIFRADLGYQKSYLLAVLSKLEKGEKQILAALARIDYPLPQKQRPARKRPTLRTAAAVVLFISKARLVGGR